MGWDEFAYLVLRHSELLKKGYDSSIDSSTVLSLLFLKCSLWKKYLTR